MASATIKLFLPRGDAKSLRTAEISNWTGKAIAAPRTELDGLLAREELGSAGVYILIGPDPKTDEPRAYVGESDSIRKRLATQKSQEFWVTAMAFIATDDSLTKAHVRYLEKEIWSHATKIGRFKLIQNEPTGSNLPESDRADMEVFFSRIRQILPVLGSDILVPVAPHTNNPLLFCRVKGAEARGQRTPGGFVVFAGSTAVVSEVRSLLPRVVALRNELVTKGVLVKQEASLVFTEDTEFSGPSLAASVVRGVGGGGRGNWTNAAGITLKQLDEQP
ncbi:MAG TPA: GIY-YIG nuclease family protein [Paludibaculum sp.]|jgi:hypothetical protein